MISEQRQGIRIVEFWTCSNPEHMHRLKSKADECIAKSERTTTKQAKNHWTKESRVLLLNRFESGESTAAIGKDYGISAARIYELIRRTKRDLKRSASIASTLS